MYKRKRSTEENDNFQLERCKFVVSYTILESFRFEDENEDEDEDEALGFLPVSYTHLTLPTKLEV